MESPARPLSWSGGEPAGQVTELQAMALDYLRQHHTVSLATQGTAGLWATTVFYANLGFTLYFLSEPKTLHVQNILTTPGIAATVNEDYQDWQKIKGIQLSGICEEAASFEESAAALNAYVEKYPFVGSFLGPERSLEGMKVAGRPLDVRMYAVRPTRLLYLDNQRGFSNREEVPLEVRS